MIPRALAAVLGKMATKFPVVTLTGPRQSGKSTLVRDVFAGHTYSNLEEPDTRAFAQSDPRGYLASLGARAIIDEVQRAPDILSYIQVDTDSHPGNGRYVLTGSQNLLLAQAVSQSLAGRTAVLELLPLSAAELAAANRAPASVERWIHSGGYPRLYKESISPIDFYPAYSATYVERDVRTVTNITDLGRFQTLLKMCAARTGQILNYESMANDCGVSANTVKAWVSVLETTFVVHLLRPHFANYSKRLIKSPKLYFYDTGLACSLLNITDPSMLTTHHLRGPLFETAVVSEILKHYRNRGRTPPVFYWRDKTGHEIDCLVDSGNTVQAVEIKAGMTVAPDWTKGISYYRGLAPSATGMVVYAGTQSQQRSDTTFARWDDFARFLPDIG